MNPRSCDAVDASILVVEAAGMAENPRARRQVRVPDASWEAWGRRAQASATTIHDWLGAMADAAARRGGMPIMPVGRSATTPRWIEGTDSQWRSWERAAELAGVPVAKWLRAVGDQAAGLVHEPELQPTKRPPAKVEREPLFFRASDDEWNSWANAAVAQGLTIAEWLRLAVARELEAPSKLDASTTQDSTKRPVRKVLVAPSHIKAAEAAAAKCGGTLSAWVRAVAEQARSREK